MKTIVGAFIGTAIAHPYEANLNKCVSGNGSEKFRQGRHTIFLNYFFWKKIKFYAL